MPVKCIVDDTFDNSGAFLIESKWSLHAPFESSGISLAKRIRNLPSINTGLRPQNKYSLAV